MMRTSSARTLCMVVAALCLTTEGLHAQGRGRGNGKVPPGIAKAGGTPPGLAKKGGLPPGQAKKIYRPDDGVGVLRDVFGQHGYTVVRTSNDGDRRYVYYRLRDGSIHRATVSPGAERLSFRNVPESLLREVLARLY
jgi:hypothetical protein